MAMGEGLNWSRRGLLAAGAAAAVMVSSRALAQSGAPETQTASGRVRGRLEDGVAAFKGIPYGAPTGGGARFAAPQPVRPWGATRNAFDYGDQCPQARPTEISAFSSWETRLSSSEDCLWLNVWTPGADQARRPVMVWLPGAVGTYSNAASPVADGARLAKRGDVVVVSVNHRLNVFGYLHLPDLPGSGNTGQLDIIAALQWVKDNIAAFGGDPAKVTVFGQSGGAARISALMAMPAARGLFHRAAIQSGPWLSAISAEEAAETTQTVMSAIGAGNSGALRTAPFPRLVDGLRAATEAGKRFGPVVDGRHLPRQPFTPDGPPQSADVPVLIGYTAAETTVLPHAANAFDVDWAGLPAALGPSLGGADAGALIAGMRRLRPTASAADLYFAITTERALGEPCRLLAERKAAQGSAGAYLYRLDFRTPGESLRAAHGLDVPLVFDNVARSLSLIGSDGAKAQAVAEAMAGAWIAFARTGSPNAPGLASWPRYDARARSTMLFNETSRAVSDPNGSERALIEALP